MPCLRDGNPWIRQSRTQVYENTWIQLHHDEVIRPDGRPGIYGVVHFRARSVGVVAIDAHDRVLLVGQYRYTIERYSWEIPAGGADAGEDTQAAARRELKEETGYSADSICLLIHAHMSNSITDEESYCYLANGLHEGEPSPEGTEAIRLRWLDFNEALRAITAGEITDALTILGLQQLAISRAQPKSG